MSSKKTDEEEDPGKAHAAAAGPLRDQKRKKAAAPRRDDVDVFIDEVTEELQKERAYRLFRRYGPVVGAVVVAIVLAASVNEYLKSAEVTAAREAGASLIAAGDTETLEQAAEGYAAARGDLEGGPALVAALHAAAIESELGRGAAAAEAFEAAAALAADEPIYAELATLRAALARFDEAEPDVLIAALEPLAAGGRPFRTLALELLGLAELRAGRMDAARARLLEAYEAEGAPQDQRRRLADLLQGAGAEVPETAPAAAHGDAVGG